MSQIENASTKPQMIWKQKPLAWWTIEEVAECLKEFHFGQEVVSKFIENEISGLSLLGITEPMMVSLGITSIGKRLALKNLFELFNANSQPKTINGSSTPNGTINNGGSYQHKYEDDEIQRSPPTQDEDEDESGSSRSKRTRRAALEAQNKLDGLGDQLLDQEKTSKRRRKSSSKLSTDEYEIDQDSNYVEPTGITKDDTNPKEVTEDNTCPYCNRVFSNKGNRNRHINQKRCIFLKYNRGKVPSDDSPLPRKLNNRESEDDESPETESEEQPKPQQVQQPVATHLTRMFDLRDLSEMALTFEQQEQANSIPKDERKEPQQ